jgi:hypothetical protein
MGAAASRVSVPLHHVGAVGTAYKYSGPVGIKKELWIAGFQKNGWVASWTLSHGYE